MLTISKCLRGGGECLSNTVCETAYIVAIAERARHAG